MGWSTFIQCAVPNRGGISGAVSLSALFLMLCLPRPASPQEVVAVFSSDLQPYRDAYAGFVHALGDSVPIHLTDQLHAVTDETQVVVTFGSRAAMAAYPDQVARIHCLAPAAFSETAHRSGVDVRIHMLPTARQVMASLKRVQPSMKRLAVLWILREPAVFFDELEHAAREWSVEFVGEALESTDDLPIRLRSLMHRQIDAIWLPPDPLLISPRSLSTVKEFAWSNDVAFYAPTAGFVEAGAVASIAPSFRQIGTAAAEIALQVLQGRSVPSEVYPPGSELTLNVAAAQRCGLTLPDELETEVDHIFGEGK